MKLSEIKSQLGIARFNLNKSLDANNQPTEWYRHWDNENRRAISIHKELLTKLKVDSTVDSLGLQKEVRTTSKGKYTAYRIVEYNPSDETL